MRPRAARLALASWRSKAQSRAFAQPQAVPEFERAGDGAEGVLLKTPAAGGFLRSNFVAQHNTACEALGAYDLQGELGRGAFGSVRAAKHRDTQQSVAVKTVPKSDTSDMAAMRSEISFLKSMDHPNVVRLYETIEDASSLFLVMEHCSGGELWERILSAHDSGLGFGERELAEAAQQMLRGLSYCHASNVVHRDVKPQNFLYASTEEGAVLKLVDFGVSGVTDENIGRTGSRRMLTRMVGTDGYIAPEILLSKPYGPAADIFSVGATMHAAVVGLPPRWELDKSGEGSGSMPGSTAVSIPASAWRGGGKPAYIFPGKMRWRMLSPEFQTLMTSLVDPDPAARPSAAEALRSPWFQRLKTCEVGGGEGMSAFLDESLVERMRRFGKRSKLQQCAFASVVAFSRFHCKEYEELRNAFLAADADLSGEVSAEELAAVLVASGSATATEVEDIVAAVDTSRDGKITYSEWVASAASKALFSTQDGVRRAFDVLDRDGDGVISAAEIEAALPGVMAHAEILQGIRQFDQDGDDHLDLQEFKTLLRGGITSMEDF